MHVCNFVFVSVNFGGLVLQALLENWPPAAKEEISGIHNTLHVGHPLFALYSLFDNCNVMITITAVMPCFL